MAPRRHGSNGHASGLLEASGGLAGLAVGDGGSSLENSLNNNNSHSNGLTTISSSSMTSTSSATSVVASTHCCIPSGECLRNDSPIRLNSLQDAVKVTCNNDNCPAGQYMHRECFDSWEQTVLTYLKSCGRARSWSERQRHQNLWTKKGYDLAFKACGCRCGRGHLKKDLDWMPPGVNSASGNGRHDDNSDAKKKKRRNRQNTRPSLAVSAGPPGINNHANHNGSNNNNNNNSSCSSSSNGHHHHHHASRNGGGGISEAQLIESGRGRAGSLSSSTGSSSPPATSEPSVSPLHQPQAIVKKKSKVDFFGDRARQSCGANGIFTRRLDFSAFNSLPRTKLNSYHIKDIVAKAKARKVTFRSFTEKSILKLLGIAYGLMAAQQLSGINAVIFYGVTIFEATGVEMDSLLQSVILGVVQIIACVISAALVDKLGRKFLMIVSEGMMCVCLVGLGIFFHVKDHYPDSVDSISWLPLTSTCIYILAFCLGAGPIPWAYMGEIFPTRLKGAASSSAAFFNWALAFLVTISFESLVVATGTDVVFFAFAVICALSVVFVIFCMVETKGKTFAQIQDEFNIVEPE